MTTSNSNEIIEKILKEMKKEGYVDKSLISVGAKVLIPHYIIPAIEKAIKEKDKEFLEKPILDACCGPRCFWFQKKEEHTIFIDNREEEKGFIDNRENRFVKPDMIMDFRKMDFKDKSFKLVVFDPPHIISKGRTCRMTKIYGNLNKETWKEDIKKGFDECWRVLDDYGVLIFKWSECNVKRRDILEVIGKTPLFGHPNGSKIPTHWFCFMKFPEELKNQIQKGEGKK